MKNKLKHTLESWSAGAAFGLITLSWITSGCTKMLPSQFLLSQQQQKFAATSNLSVNTKIDMLWVVDNSSSMDPQQAKLRAGFAAFANKYMQPTWDIHVAAITTDTYIANSEFSTYLSSVISGSANAQDPYVYPLVMTDHTYTTPTQNSAWNTSELSVVDLLTGLYNSAGVIINDLIPAWGPNYAKLIPGIHDGPVTALCSSFMPYLLDGEEQCATRDSRAQTGTADCLNPTGSETSTTQCVNTVQNDTIHTGNPIVATKPPLGTPGNQAWIDSITDQLIVNLTTGSSGSGSERGLGSVAQFLTDNEANGSPTAFFRANSLRVIIFISDEDDQTITYANDGPSPTPSIWTHYLCDQAGLTSLNSGDPARLPASFCGSSGTTFKTSETVASVTATGCSPKTILNSNGSNYTFTISTCPNPNLLIPVSTFQTQLNSFFEGLDGTTSNPNYFVVTITPLTGDSVAAVQAIHNVDDTAAGAPAQITANRADRYISLGTLVGNGSFSSDIDATDYTSVLTSIGNEVAIQMGTFNLQYPATSVADMIVTIAHADGTSTVLGSSQYTVSGTTFTITDLNVVLTFLPTDSVVINYQPSSSIS